MSCDGNGDDADVNRSTTKEVTGRDADNHGGDTPGAADTPAAGAGKIPRIQE